MVGPASSTALTHRPVPRPDTVWGRLADSVQVHVTRIAPGAWAGPAWGVTQCARSIETVWKTIHKPVAFLCIQTPIRDRLISVYNIQRYCARGSMQFVSNGRHSPYIFNGNRATAS